MNVFKNSPDSKDLLTFNNEWKLKEATCGRPHLSVPSCTSSSYFIHRAVSFHSRSSPVPFNSSSWTKTCTNKSIIENIYAWTARRINKNNTHFISKGVSTSNVLEYYNRNNSNNNNVPHEDCGLRIF